MVFWVAEIVMVEIIRIVVIMRISDRRGKWCHERFAQFVIVMMMELVATTQSCQRTQIDKV